MVQNNFPIGFGTEAHSAALRQPKWSKVMSVFERLGCSRAFHDCVRAEKSNGPLAAHQGLIWGSASLGRAAPAGGRVPWLAAQQELRPPGGPGSIPIPSIDEALGSVAPGPRGPSDEKFPPAARPIPHRVTDHRPKATRRERPLRIRLQHEPIRKRLSTRSPCVEALCLRGVGCNSTKNSFLIDS